ncbi:MAG TPA: hypothetical protein VGG17_10375 [Acidimicrobiales bacterium]
MGAITRDRNGARIQIVGGFAIAALGALISFVNWIANGGIRYSSNSDVQSFAATFAVVTGVVAWWFLSQIVMSDVTPPLLARRALRWLMLEELCFAVASLAFVIEFRHLTFAWPLVGNVLVGLGALLSAAGFFSMMRTFQNGTSIPQSSDA